MFANQNAYDSAITVFSPDGRLFQVEYALETVKRGSTVLGITCPDGVVLAAEERTVSRLQDPAYTWKIFEIDTHLGAAIAGLSSDARILVDQARLFAQSNRLSYDEPVDVEVLSNWVGDVAQQCTQYGGVRPFGVAIIFGGVDAHGSKVLHVDPSGAVWAYKAVAVGAGGDAVNQLLTEKYQPECTLNHAILLAVECLAKIAEGTPDPAKMKVATIPATTKTMTTLPPEALAEYLNRATA